MEIKCKYIQNKNNVFRKGGILPRHLEFSFENNMLEIVRKLSYLGVVFTTGGSFAETQNMLVEQARKTLYILKNMSLVIQH